MAIDHVATIADLLESINSLQSKKFQSFLSTTDEVYRNRANRFFSQYEKLLNYLGKDFAYSVECYDQMLSEMVVERILFLETGKYSNDSFEDVNTRLYTHPDAFDHHMHGLALAQFLWWDQYQRFAFFADNLYKYRDQIHRYLEISAGHGLYISEALEQLKNTEVFDLVDISPTSLEMSKVALETDRVNYMLQDIYSFSTDKKYDFITIGEVIEHLEDPKSLMLKLRDLLADNGTIYITTPANAPMIDHIYLFKSKEEIHNFIVDSGFEIIDELAVFAENMEAKKAIKKKVALMYAAFIRKSKKN